MSWFDDLMKDPLALSNVGNTLDVSGQMIRAMGQIQAGSQTKGAADFQADQLRTNVGQTIAAAQRQAFEIDRQAQYTASAALAAAAASGGGASDPSVVTLIARNASEFAYRKAVTLYDGEDRARVMGLQADAKEFEGKQAKANSKTEAMGSLYRAGSTLLKGNARDGSLYQRFGGGGPNATAS